MYGPGQAHMWAWPRPNMGPGPWARPMGPGPGRARLYWDKNIFQKQYPEKP